MNYIKKTPRTSAREKILTAAATLFYEQGYQATTVDNVIERSGVSRPTLYTHFSTKEELGVAYLHQRRQHDLAALKDAIRQAKNPHGRFLAIMAQIKDTLIGTNYRGCGFFNVIAELHDATNPLVKEARRYVEGVRELIRDTVVELKSTDKKYKGLDVDRVTDVYYLLVAGAIMGSQEYQDRWPIDRAMHEVERLIEG